MKNAVSMLIMIILLCSLSSCSKEKPIENQSGENLSTTNLATESEVTTEEATTEWTNPYAENHREISKQTLLFDGMVDYDYHTFEWAKNELDICECWNEESCIAIVTLVNIGESRGESSLLSSMTTDIYLKVDKVLDSNGIQGVFKEGYEFSTQTPVGWRELNDGTYEIEFFPYMLPFSEVGGKYVACISNGEKIRASAISLPFDSAGNYIDTLAVGNEGIDSHIVLWYYDINPIYYKEYWENHVEDYEIYESQGIDVYDKYWLFQES